MDTKVGQGSLNKNKNKDTEKHPDYKGSVVFDRPIAVGTRVWFAGWIKENSTDGSKFVSLAASVSEVPRQEQRREAEPPRRDAARQPARRDDMDDDIPF